MIRPETIHSHLREFLQDRAEFLWSLYQRYSDRHQSDLTDIYLDIGAGDLTNAILFQQKTGIRRAVGIDTRSNLTKSPNVAIVQADARAIPFKNQSIGLVTMFSLIEHVSEPLLCLSEALRVLKGNGLLFMQFPNRYFPIELHSGLCMYFYLSESTRKWLALNTGRLSMKGVDVPAVEKVRRMLHQLAPVREVVTAGFFYPELLLPKSGLTRAMYRIFKHLHFFRILPMGYIIMVRAQSRGAQERLPA